MDIKPTVIMAVQFKCPKCKKDHVIPYAEMKDECDETGYCVTVGYVECFKCKEILRVVEIDGEAKVEKWINPGFCMDDYQEMASETLQPQCDNLEYLMCGMIEELGEVAGKRKRMIRGDETSFESSIDEGGDLFWYFSQYFRHIKVRLSVIGKRNLEKLKDRKQRGVIAGTGDNR